MKGKLLIVDDQADVRGVLTAVLEPDYQVIEADSGAALQKVPIAGQPIKITVATGGVHVNHPRKAVSVPGFTAFYDSG